VIANTPAIDGARIFGAIVPVVTVLGGFTCKPALARDADTEDGHEIAPQRASGTILDWPAALAHALRAHVLGALVPVVAVVGALAFRHAAGSTVASDTAVAAHTAGATVSAVTSRATRARRFATTHHGQRKHTHKSKQVTHINLPGCGAVRP
jgi:hypothetical protein